MVLNDIPDCAGFVVEFAAVLDAEVLRHGDLDGAHVVAIPDRLKNGVGKAGVENVLDRLLPQKMVDAEDPRSGKYWYSISLSSCAEAKSRPKGFSTTTRAFSAQPDLASPSATCQTSWGSPDSAAAVSPGPTPGAVGESVRIVVVTVHVAQKARQLVERILVEAAVLF